MMKWGVSIVLYICFFVPYNIIAQDDLEFFLDPLPQNNTVINTFKSTRIINNHSIEIFQPRQLDFRISHRFGRINSGIYEVYGLDQATIRIGLEYGVLKNLMMGIGRSSYQKTYDGYLKYLLLNQNRGIDNVPVSIVLFSNIAVNTLEKNYLNYPFFGRLSYCNQLLIGSKVNSELSLQFMPTWIHWNMVDLPDQKNQLFVLGGGLRYLITRSVSINAEYFYRVSGSLIDKEMYYNSFSIGLDIETGGHVFQLHLTNSMSMNESGFITRTNGNWFDGGIHFGFNISREFNL
jgi:hypothetical protein